MSSLAKVARLLTEEEVDARKAAGTIMPGQCHAAFDYVMTGMKCTWVCTHQRDAYRRTCSDHREVIRSTGRC